VSPTGSNALSSEELRRYSRHLALPDVGVSGQEKLKAARVLLIGAGGLSSPAALYLAAAGVGTIGIVDFDVVDVTNLQRQILHGTKDVGRSKLESARARLGDVNPHVQVTTHDTRLTSANALDILREYDVVLDGTDNFATRYLTNDACVILGKPNVYGSIFRFHGQASVFATKDGPCYRCLFPDPPPPGVVPSCEEGGVLGVLPGIIGTIQATEAVKLILGVGQTLAGRLLTVDTLTMQFLNVEVPRDPMCPACGTREIRELIDYDEYCGDAPASVILSEAKDQLSAKPGGEQLDELPENITPTDLAVMMAASSDIDVIDVREPYEHRIARIEGSRLIPMRELQAAVESLDPDRGIVVYCHTGARSARAAHFLRASGFRAANLLGGIKRWSQDVDPEVPDY
jgi:sulfur-carrier protein adenylyltransferase/sulfurtransferase